MNLSAHHSLVGLWMRELRDVTIQRDRQRFRRNLERIGEVAAYEISKQLNYKEEKVTTPLGVASCPMLQCQPVLGTILRAGLPLHQGLLNYFDQADHAFISAYRKHEPDGTFAIQLEYVSCPALDGRVLILADPMLATGASLVKTLQSLLQEGQPEKIHLVSAIACTTGIEWVQSHYPEAVIWTGDVDDEITDKGYIVPGLGDAGDLAFGTKNQQ